MAFKRYKGPDGSEFTIDEAAAASMGDSVTLLADKDAVDGNGVPLPPKQNIHKGGTLPAKSASRPELEDYAINQAGMDPEAVAAFANKPDLYAALADAAGSTETDATDAADTSEES